MTRQLVLSKEELESLYWDKGMSTHEIARLKGCSQRGILNSMRRFGITRRSIVDAIRKRRLIHADFGERETLAYVLGVVKGDGFVGRWGNGGYVVRLDVASRRFAMSFFEALKRLGLRPRLIINKLSAKDSRRQDIYDVYACSNELCEWLKGMSVEKIEEFLGDDEDLIRGFLRGFYESEGYLECESENDRKLVLYNTSAEIVGLVERLLKRLGFGASVHGYEARRPGWKDYYIIRILGGAAEVERFLREVEPCIKNIPYKGKWRDNVDVAV